VRKLSLLKKIIKRREPIRGNLKVVSRENPGFSHNGNVSSAPRRMMYAIRLASSNDVYKIIQLLKKETIVIVGLKKIMLEDSEYAKELLSKLIEFIKEINGDCLLLGQHYLILTPENTSIIKLPDSNIEETKNADTEFRPEKNYSPET